MMANTDNPDIKVKLTLYWNGDFPAGEARRNAIGFGKIKEAFTEHNDSQPVQINAFLFAFLASAKNLDLFLSEIDSSEVEQDLQTLSEKLGVLEKFERDGIPPDDRQLKDLYLQSRKIAERPNARDEQRTLAALLYSGPSSAEQIQQDLGINSSLAVRVLRALYPIVLPFGAEKTYGIAENLNALAVALYLLRYCLGIDPVKQLLAFEKE